jgi:hypothetical protein
MKNTAGAKTFGMMTAWSMEAGWCWVGLLEVSTTGEGQSIHFKSSSSASSREAEVGIKVG